MKKSLLFICILILYTAKLNAQINLNYPDVDDWVRKNFSGLGIIMGNITHKGNQDAIASFTSSKNVLKIQSGLLISTGEALGALGPNDQYNVSKDFENVREFDKDLKTIVRGDLFDVSLIEFDFVSFHNSMNFMYQFGSDEYPEYVGTTFNDIFAFFVSDGKTTKNIALIPGKNLPVSINTINTKSDSLLFIDNNVFVNNINKKGYQHTSSSQPDKVTKKVWNSIKNVFSSNNDENNDEYEPNETMLNKVNKSLYNYLQYDGITQKLSAQMYVEPYKRYHLKIIIADVTDNVYDSAVFLESKSFVSYKDTKQPGFKDYPDYSKIIDPKLILAGKKLEDILPQEVEIPNTNIYFDFDKIIIPPKEMDKVKLLTNIYDKIKLNYRIEITGNTDSIGTYDYNFKLSKTRSEVVISALQKAIPTFKFDKVEYKSYTEPNSSNSTEEGRKLNRRVHIKFIRNKKNG